MFCKYWYPNMIKQHILSRYGVEPLNSHYYATTYPSVYAAADRIFGSWEAAITMCGLDYEQIRKYKRWSREAVLEKIKKLHDDGETISSQAVQNNQKSLYMASLKRFGCWKKAVEAAGIDYAKVRLRRSLSKQEIKRQIMALYKSKVDLSYTNVRKNYQYLLAYGSKKLGDGSWAKARQRCGIKVNYRLENRGLSTRPEKDKPANIPVEQLELF